VLLIVLLAHTTWDYFEARWLKTAMATWPPSDDTSSNQRALPHERNAAPYYRAAASLLAGSASGVFPSIRVRGEIAKGPLSDAMLDRLLSDGTLDHIGQALAASADGLGLLDRATEREFAGFSGFWATNVPGLPLAQRILSMRALYASMKGDGALAVRSLRAELKLEAVRRAAIPEPVRLSEWLKSWGRSDVVSNIQFVLSHVAPDSTALDSLADTLTDADDDTEFARFFTRARDLWSESYLNRLGRSYDGSLGSSGLLGAGRATLWNRIFRPVIARDLRWKLQHYSQIIEAAKTPWPDRIDRIVATRVAPGWLRRTLGERLAIYPGDPGWAEDAEPWWQVARLRIAAADLAGIRAARIAVAVERHRRTHNGELPASLDDLMPAWLPALPIDPFSGHPMLFARENDGYVIYSVGPDRLDNGGEQAGTKVTIDDKQRGPAPRMTGDIGVRIRTRPR
jgi:hypothetical protein